ncbi:MAG: flavodoxin [Anaerolineae bacterium]|nr:flavodoxin [Anaerolineae bacterium]NIN96140.1 flavodoxin [Anaerolineae bacterium]NIQ79155.1 flavodoxin [Anaerolineae bacterium]
MNALVVYDSTFGNTESIAEAIADVLAQRGTARLLRVNKVQPGDLEGIDLLVAGCPTQRRKPTPAIVAFLGVTPAAALEGLAVAAFDTRYRRFRLVTGSAARALAKRLRKAGAALLLPPESFFVLGREGPLEEGELGRAADWARKILNILGV